MERTILTCDCCGREFYSRHWRSGYIDHVTNFSSHYKSYTDESSECIARRIMFSGNRIRTVYDIVTRFDCFMTWNNISDDKKHQVKNIVDKMVKLLEDAGKTARQIENSALPMALAILRGDDLDDSFLEAFGSIIREEVEV